MTGRSAVHRVLGAIALWVVLSTSSIAAPDAAQADCNPKGVDVCAEAKAWAEASDAMPLFHSTEKHLAAGRPAFESPSAVGREYRQNVVMPFESAVRKNINADQTFANAVVASDMHGLARTTFCAGRAIDFIDRGGVLRVTYFFRDRIKITEVVITDCSVGAVTWDKEAADPCAPYGFEICKLVASFADGMEKTLAKGKASGEKPETHHEMTALHADRGTLIIDFRDHHTREEQQNGRPESEPDTNYIEHTRKLALRISCAKPPLDFVTYGGTVRSRFFSADGHLTHEHTISFCEKAADTKSGPSH